MPVFPVFRLSSAQHPFSIQGSIIPAVMTLSVRDGKLKGIWVSMDQEMELIDLKFDGEKLSFKRTMGEGGDTINFDGTVKGNEISGKYISPMGGEYKCTGKRKTTE
jgi:signal peptidase I